MAKEAAIMTEIQETLAMLLASSSSSRPLGNWASDGPRALRKSQKRLWKVRGPGVGCLHAYRNVSGTVA
jgi:hypothetical protein